MTTFPTPEEMRERFAELDATREAMIALSEPLRAERDRITAETNAQLDTLDDQIREAEAGLFDIDQERAMIARALGGRTGVE